MEGELTHEGAWVDDWGQGGGLFMKGKKFKLFIYGGWREGGRQKKEIIHPRDEE